MKPATRKIVYGVLAAALVLAATATAGNTRLEQSRQLTATFGAKLQAELKQALEAGGPVGGVEVCKDRAPQIASELSRQSGAKVGRTSLRFRNPANAPEAWQSAVLQEFDQAVARASDEPLEYFEEDGNGTVRYMAAIRTGAVCLVCHGPALGDALDAELTRDYPHDRARGYALGDVRGAFSVTWPASTAEPER